MAPRLPRNSPPLPGWLAVAIAILLAASGCAWSSASPSKTSTQAAATTADEIHYTFTGADSVTFDWRGSADTISYGLTPDYGSSVVASSPTPEPWSSPGPYWEARLDLLLPGTTYHYSIGGGPDSTFTTAPVDDFRFVAVGDIGESITSPWVDDQMAQIAAENPSFVLVLGDLSYANYNCPQAVNQHFNDAMVWSREAAYMPAWGNHEYAATSVYSQPCALNDTFANYKGRFDLPNPQTLSINGPNRSTAPGCPLVEGTNPCQGEDWSWFDAGHVRFITAPEPFSGAAAEWGAAAEPIMAAAQADPNIYFVVTAMHRPSYSSGRLDADYRQAVDSLADSYSKYVLNLNGHEHNNEVFSPQHGVFHVTAGAGGEGLKSFTDPPAAGSTFRLKHNGYALIDVVDKTMTLSVVCGPNSTKPEQACTPGDRVYTVDVSGNRAPQARFTVSCEQLSCTFDGTPSTDRDGVVTDYAWTFGDGTSAEGPLTTHTYAQPGTYEITLKVADDAGASTSASQSMKVESNLPAIGFVGAATSSAARMNHYVTVPASVQTGDGMLLFFSVNNGLRTVTPPSGWTEVGRVVTSATATYLWDRVARSGEAGRKVTIGLDSSAKGAVTLLAYSGTADVGPVEAHAATRETILRRNHVTPVVETARPGVWAVSYWSDKSTYTTGWEIPAQLMRRTTVIGSGTGHVTAVSADAGTTVPPGTYGGLSATANAASKHGSMWTVILSPAN